MMGDKKYIFLLQVEVGFLMVGHTHEDVDALFGHISMWLRKHDAVTLKG